MVSGESFTTLFSPLWPCPHFLGLRADPSQVANRQPDAATKATDLIGGGAQLDVAFLPTARAGKPDHQRVYGSLLVEVDCPAESRRSRQGLTLAAGGRSVSGKSLDWDQNGLLEPDSGNGRAGGHEAGQVQRSIRQIVWKRCRIRAT